MPDKIVTEDPTQPGVLKVNGPTLSSSGKVLLTDLDTTGAVNGDVIVLVGGAFTPGVGGGGSADTASNLGTGTGVFASKVGADFQFKSLTAGSNIAFIASGTEIQINSATGVGTGQIVIFQDQKPSGTSGGTAATLVWSTHILNTEVADPANLATLAANQITLAAGTYRVNGSAQYTGTHNSKIRLRNITDSTTLAIGESILAATSGTTGGMSVMQGRFTIAVPKVLELQYYVGLTVGLRDLGYETASGEVEVYADLVFLKE